MNIFSNLTRFTSALAPNAEPYLHENFYRNIDINRKIKSGKPLCYRTLVTAPIYIYNSYIYLLFIDFQKVFRRTTTEYVWQSRFDARYCMLGAGALGRPRGTEWGGRREEGSGWGTHVYLWRIHFDIWQI